MYESESALITTAQRFATALLSADEAAVAAVCAESVTWSVAGHSVVSGLHAGVPALVAVARANREYRITVTVDRILTGREGVLVLLHEGGDREGKHLDTHVALALAIRGGLVTAVTGFIEDTAAYDEYLV